MGVNEVIYCFINELTLTALIYIYIYIYKYVCVCVCVCVDMGRYEISTV